MSETDSRSPASGAAAEPGPASDAAAEPRSASDIAAERRSPSPDPAVAAVRLAVRTALLAEYPTGGRVMVACSGGADSLALAAAARFVASRLGIDCGLVTVDHGLQAGSRQRAVEVARIAERLGLDPVEVATVEVGGRRGGPEAAARQARYEALIATGLRHGAGVLVGHTLDDQAETVLLALARGAGPRGLAGIARRSAMGGVVFLRPMLGLSRQLVAEACRAERLEPWHDPHNTDPAYARSRVRAGMDQLVGTLGPALVANLARTADLLADDVAYLDRQAELAMVDCAAPGIRPDRSGLSVAALRALPPALRSRVLHRFAAQIASGGSAMSYRHVAALDAMVTHWRGQGPVALPGGARIARIGAVLAEVDGDRGNR